MSNLSMYEMVEKLAPLKRDLVSDGFDEALKIIESQLEFIKERTNAKELDLNSDGDKKFKETFKKNIDFKIKDKSGEIAIDY